MLEIMNESFRLSYYAEKVTIFKLLNYYIIKENAIKCS